MDFRDYAYTLLFQLSKKTSQLKSNKLDRGSESMTAPLSKRVETGAEKEQVKQKEKKKLNWKLWGTIGGLCGSVLILFFIILGVRNRSTGKKESVNTMGNNSKQPKSDETGGSGASRDGSRVTHELKHSVTKDSKNGSEGENGDTVSITSLQRKPPGPKVLEPIKLTRQQTAPADRINDSSSSTDGSKTRAAKTQINSVDPSGTNPMVPPPKTDTRSQQVDTSESDASGTDPNSRQNKTEPDVSPSEISLPSNFIEPTPDNLSEDVANVIKSVDNPNDFENALNELRRKAQAPESLSKSKAPYYADNLVETEMRKVVLKNVMEGDEEKIKAALDKYHKAVLQTKAVSELPSDADDIKEVEMYRIVRKCLSEGTLSASEKTKLEDILVSPDSTYTINQSHRNTWDLNSKEIRWKTQRLQLKHILAEATK